MTPTLFTDLDLSPELEKAIRKLGFEQASPIQAASIPVLMAGRDVVGQSQTGSGKTAAFGIPAIEKTDPKLRAVQVLVLCPTRELAVQVAEEVHKLALYKRGIVGLPIYGGQSYERQFAGLKQGAQIVIGTPGRVMDHMRRGSLILDQLHTIVLDEADVMLDMGFREDIEFVLKSLPEERQTVFFSATMPRPIRSLIESFAKNPESIQIEQEAMTVPTVEQSVYEVDRRSKVVLLTRLIDIHDLNLGIIFCNTKAMVDELVEHLVTQGYQADRLHGDMTQQQRDRVMNRFRRSGLEFLVATDVAARGIDVDNVEVVFNYDLPYDPEDYVHRIGRTGRAGRSGMAVSFASGREIFKIRNIERYTKQRITRGRLPSLQDVDQARDGHLLKRVRTTLEQPDHRSQQPLIERLLEEGFVSTDIASALLHLLRDGESTEGNKGRRDELAERQTDRDRPYRQDGRGGRGDSRRDGRGDRGARGPRGRDSREDRDFRGGRDSRGGKDFRPQRDFREGRDFRERRDFREGPDSRPARPSARPAASGEVIRMPGAAKKTFSEKTASPASPASRGPAVSPDSPASPAPTAPKAPKEPVGESVAKAFPSAPAKKSGSSFSRIRLSVGEEDGLTTGTIRDLVLGETGLSVSSVGRVDVKPDHVTLEVVTEEAKSAVSKLKRAKVAGKRIKARLAGAG